jgi:hypothetical protein
MKKQTVINVEEMAKNYQEMGAINLEEANTWMSITNEESTISKTIMTDGGYEWQN